MVVVYVCVLLVTSLLTMTAAYAFQDGDILDLYTSNFSNPTVFKYVLELYPVLALPANIPIFAITLRENLKSLLVQGSSSNSHVGSLGVRFFVFPLISLAPSVGISLYTYQVARLVAFTGSYAGAIIEYVLPTILVLLARSKAKKLFGTYQNNRYLSMFNSHGWSVLILVWYLACVSITVMKAF